MMAVPLSEDKTENKITELKNTAEKQKKCLKCMSYFFFIAGIGGILNGIYCMSTAATNANYIVTNKKLPWGHHKHHAPTPTHEASHE